VLPSSQFAASSNVLPLAKARQIPEISPRDSYASVAAKTVAVRTEEVFARQHEVLALDDIEALHDTRVATRRLRAALEVFEPCFPRGAFRRVLAEVKRLADTLGERRDLDVQIEWLERYASARGGAERPAILGFVAALRAEQSAANDTLAELLEDVRSDDLEGRLHELADHAASSARRRPARSAR
jgi:CHAD domain-containing protein